MNNLARSNDDTLGAENNSQIVNEDDENKAHKVHFTGTEDMYPDHSSIAVQKMSDSKINVNLGFLKLRHRYEIRFRVSNRFAQLFQSAIALPNLNAKYLGISKCEGNDHEVKMEIFACKEKLMREAITFESCSSHGIVLTIVLNARVLGNGKGTPSIKNGIRCIGIEPDDESEASDWTGFD